MRQDEFESYLDELAGPGSTRRLLEAVELPAPALPPEESTQITFVKLSTPELAFLKERAALLCEYGRGVDRSLPPVPPTESQLVGLLVRAWILESGRVA